MSEEHGNFESILRLSGELGWWQVMVLAWSFLGGALVNTHDLSAVFIAEIPSHHCLLPAGGRAQDWLPIDNATGEFDQCSVMTFPGSNTSVPCSRYTYEWSNYSSSVASEWNLVCSNRWLASTVQATYTLGVCCGATFWGVVSDQFGRKRAVVLAAMAFLVMSVTSAFANSYNMLLALKFVTAMAQIGVYSCSVILCMEITSRQWRALLGLLCAMSMGIGGMLLSAVAYVERDWRNLQLYISLPAVLMLALWWVLPESPRWLIMQDRLQEALSVLKFAAGRNGRQLPPDDQLLNMMAKFHASEVGDAKAVPRSVWTRCMDGIGVMAGLLRTRKMRHMSLANFCIWLIIGLVYYGVSFGTANLSDSPHLAILLSGLAEVPAVLLSALLIDRLGRRVVIIATHLMAGATALCTSALPAGPAWPTLLLGTLGKLACSANFAVLFVYSSEFFPTQLRNAGFGASVVFARLGSMSAPYIVDLLTPVHWTIPSCVFGASAVVAALVAFMLPETVGRRMPETIEDIENGYWETAQPARSEQTKDDKEAELGMPVSGSRRLDENRY